mmetsp:Transcript_6193/g.9556  ORF Transcript_6193/g.9556 Transcript_6193/m.9556 type:complete len:460 (+) Transcript_6193:483-1862(+)|eukprot:CAMPEP_0184351370 /NCGR_PEP_ID=MMETSP1089-20130417/43576_1 /TAXON_ID=38269 ORGANISM="Gloeochaete wittrockiana, Strain SAG46.84" /NCGR_SAMPLE_ID=MMETSP1089 /ASSEMBLY_ACC=CAM_ASM_000445 /LENGTH=459 /DNA_ID=CAMNT_0026684699 /DNA_START=482 /DNA_END=1861 /DNA_ORIENTATION=-
MEIDVPNGGDDTDPASESTPEASPMEVSEQKRWRKLLTEMAVEARLSLRSKGRLKEQDGLIELIIEMHTHSSPIEVMRKVERWVKEHKSDWERSTLSRLVPSVGRMFTNLPLRRALKEYDVFASLTRRKYIKPNFAEIRHILNLAQVHAAAPLLKMITFDADGTLYKDGACFEETNSTINGIIGLLRLGITVAIVTAAAYPDDPTGFEKRLAGLLSSFRREGLTADEIGRFWVMGGQSNYLLQTTWPAARLKFIEPEQWQTSQMANWGEETIADVLDEAEKALIKYSKQMRLPVRLLRKERAVGIVPKSMPVKFEVLEEICWSVRSDLSRLKTQIPYCIFNGGGDVFCDVGNKSVGIGALMRYLGPFSEQETLHVGDRFTISGNDWSARNTCNVLWVAGPEETVFFMRSLLHDLRTSRTNNIAPDSSPSSRSMPLATSTSATTEKVSSRGVEKTAVKAS